jgi:predicted acetyltransferase
MTWAVRPCASYDEVRIALGVIWHYFGRTEPRPEQLDAFARYLPADRVHAARDGDAVVGGAGVYPVVCTVPGGRVPAAAVDAVAVLPTHRRRGILTALMRAQLDDCHARGEPLAALWASETTIYGRFGYGLAVLGGQVELPREHTAYATPFEPIGATRLVPVTEAEKLLAPVWEAVAARTPGMFARSSAWWQMRPLMDFPWQRSSGELRCVVLEVDGEPAAYALYRMNQSWDHQGISTGSIDIREAIGVSPTATRAIWRYLLDMDWVSQLHAWFLPLDHPLFLMLADPRRLRLTVRDTLWIRLVDVAAALTARSYGDAGAIVLELTDAFCPWNAGRWRVGNKRVERTQDAPDLRADVTALASAYLGGFSWRQLAAACRVDELRAGALARADALFRTDTAPWCPELF